jgi:hypothetical protein
LGSTTAGFFSHFFVVVAVVAVEALVLVLLVTVEEGGDTLNVGFGTVDIDTIGAAVNMEGTLAVDAAGFFQTRVVVVKEVVDVGVVVVVAMVVVVVVVVLLGEKRSASKVLNSGTNRSDACCFMIAEHIKAKLSF